MPRATPAPAPTEPLAPDVRLVRLDTLSPDPDNVRVHPENNLQAIRDSLIAFGQQKPLVITPDGLILAGNGTWHAARALGWQHIAVQVTTLDANQARAYALADNRTSELALWNEAGLAETLSVLHARALPLPGWDPDELQRLCAAVDLPAMPVPGEEPPALPTVTLAERFLVPPFSVLDARQGYWQARKRAWLALGIQSELGRGDGVHQYSEGATIKRQGGSLGHDGSKVYTERNNGLLGFSQQARSHYAIPGKSLRPATTVGATGHTQRGDGVGKPLARTEGSGAPGELAAAYNAKRLTWPHDQRPAEDLDDTSRKNLAAGRHTAATAALMDLAGGESASHQSGTSIFDPVLCELAYRWFCPPAGAILDPFAGGSVRGIVAARLGRAYTGIDLRPEQVAANEAQWAQIGGGMTTLPPVRPVPRVEDCQGYRVVRDDETPGGSKVRALLAVLPTHEAAEYVYASPAAGFAQIALAIAGQMLGKRVTICTAHRATLHACSATAQHYGARIETIPNGYLSHVQAKARAYCDATGALLLPFGLDDPAYITALACVAHDTGEQPEEVWCVAGSGVMARALRQAWPTAHLCVVVIGKEPVLPTDNVTVYRAPEPFERSADAPPPFASCGHYDAKAWRFLTQHAQPGALFWNVAGEADAAAWNVPAVAPTWLVGDSREMATLLPASTYDLLWTCPPYADLECYSDDPRDLSTMEYPDFLTAYRTIIAQSVARLKDDRFAAIVVGDIRDSQGYYRNFVSETIAAFQDAGARLYNEAILVTAVGSLPLRAGIPFTTTRKLGKTHQQVLVFCKGDPRKATAACGPVQIDDALAAVTAAETL